MLDHGKMNLNIHWIWSTYTVKTVDSALNTVDAIADHLVTSSLVDNIMSRQSIAADNFNCFCEKIESSEQLSQRATSIVLVCICATH